MELSTEVVSSQCGRLPLLFVAITAEEATENDLGPFSCLRPGVIQDTLEANKTYVLDFPTDVAASSPQDRKVAREVFRLLGELRMAKTPMEQARYVGMLDAIHRTW